MQFNRIVTDICEYIRQCGGGAYSQWYAGISKDATERLFNEHSVNRGTDNWIYRTASSATEARNIEEYFVDVLGTDGGTGGGDYSAIMVYAYKKVRHTKP